MGEISVKEKFKQKISQIEYEYWFNAKEFGKIIMIASVTAFVISVNMFYTVQNVEKTVEEADNSLESTRTLLNTQEFQRKLQGLQDLEGASFGEDIEIIIQGIQGSQSAAENTSDALERLQTSRERYQWLSLISILTFIAGLSIYRV